MFHVGLENGAEGRSQAWVLGHPGCFAYGVDGQSAIEAVPGAIRLYCEWIASHTTAPWLEADPAGSIEIHLDETFQCYSVNPDFELVKDGYEVNAWFRHDWKPLNEEEIRRGLLLLSWGREALVNLVSHLQPAILDRIYPGERWTIAGILKHIGGAEWWYQDRLKLIFERREVPEEPLARLEKVRSNLVEVLPGLAGSTRVVGVSGEFWSPRKLLRRAVWHEYDHIEHIRKLL